MDRKRAGKIVESEIIESMDAFAWLISGVFTVTIVFPLWLAALPIRLAKRIITGK